MARELTLKLKNSEKTLTKKELSYQDTLNISWEDPTIEALSLEARKEFNGEVDDETLIIKMHR